MEDEIYADNSRVIEERWPKIWSQIASLDISSIPVTLSEGLCNTISIGGIQLSSRHDRVAESRLQAAMIDEKNIAYIYGPSLGDLPVELLKRDSLERLEIKIMNPAVFSLLLYLQDQGRWLRDPRVNLSFAANDPEIGLPFFANPAELLLAEDKAGGIMQRLESEICNEFVNRKFQANDQELQARIESNRAELAADGDVSELFDTHNKCRAYLIGAGPTLTKTIETLKLQLQLNQSQQSVIIAADTAVPFLVANGVIPDIVVSIDRALESSHFEVALPKTVKLVYQPLLSNKIVREWHGPRYAAYTDSPIYHCIAQSIPKTSLFSGGSVIHPGIDLAVKMGSSEIVLLGCDFGYPLGRTHAGWQDGDLGPAVKTSTSWTLNGNDVRIKSDPNFNSYRCEIERYIQQHQAVSFYNTSREGAKITGCGYMQEFCE